MNRIYDGGKVSDFQMLVCLFYFKHVVVIQTHSQKMAVQTDIIINSYLLVMKRKRKKLNSLNINIISDLKNLIRIL